jgi:hypothetical protein
MYCSQFPRILLYKDRIFILTQREVSHALLWLTYTLPAFARRGFIITRALRKESKTTQSVRVGFEWVGREIGH